MHGAGNDYVFIDGFRAQLPDNPVSLAKSISDRHFGIGSDGLVYLVPPTDGASDVEMRMWNADGSEGAMCGNALRCIALWMHRHQPTSKALRIRTASGITSAKLQELTNGGNSAEVCVKLPAPVFMSDQAQTIAISERQISSLGGLNWPELPTETWNAETGTLHFTNVSVGNPHIVLFVDKLTDRCVRQLGSVLSIHPQFPGGTNVEWVHTVSPRRLDVRVWERGSGETLACGSGACAAAAAAIQTGRSMRGEHCDVHLPGGKLSVLWKADDDSGSNCEKLHLTGPAEVCFEGVWRH